MPITSGTMNRTIVLRLRPVKASIAKIRSMLIDTATTSNPVRAAEAPTTATEKSDHDAVK
jgi:hypothetical protein